MSDDIVLEDIILVLEKARNLADIVNAEAILSPEMPGMTMSEENHVREADALGVYRACDKMILKLRKKCASLQH